MISQSIHIALPLRKKTEFHNGIFLALLHAQRIPPHIGMIIDGKYSSLTIKGREENIPVDAVLKTVDQKKIECYFIRLKNHPVFSNSHIAEIFLEQLRCYDQVKQYESSCLSPVKDLLDEFYALPQKKEQLMYDVVLQLAENNLLENYSILNLPPSNGIILPCYTQEELNEKIEQERKPYYKTDVFKH